MPWWTFFWIVLGISGSLGPIVYYAVIRHTAAAAKRRPARILIGRARFIDGSTIAELPEAHVVRVHGAVKPLDRELHGPLGGRPCVYWRVSASVLRFSERRGRYGQRHSYWQETIDHSDGTPFVLADGAAECAVDPALATVSVGKTTTRQIARGQAMPSQLAVMLTEQGVSIDEIRSETWRFEETMIAIGAKVVVVGTGHRADRSSVQGERDYRSSQTTWIVLDGQELELLIADDKRLMRLGPTAEPTDLPPRERWQGRSVVAPEATLLPVDEYEAKLRSQRKNPWIAIVGAMALVVTIFVGIPAIRRAMQRSDRPATLTDAQVAELRDITQKHRVAAYRSDDHWRRALYAREDLAITDAPCTQVPGTPDGSAMPIGWITSGELPDMSPRTSTMIAHLDKLDAAFPAIEAKRYPEQVSLATTPAVSPIDLMFEKDETDQANVWVYDHDARRIVCRGPLNALRAVATGGTPPVP